MSIAAEPAFKAAIAADPYAFSTERAVIAACLAQPDRLAEIEATLVPSDFEGHFHRRVIEVLFGLHREGRKPSIEALVSFLGDDEIAPDLTVRGYLKGVVVDGLALLHLPIDDAIETIRDAAQRKLLAQAGSELMTAATTGSKSVATIATEAVAKMDEALSSVRCGRRKSYEVGAAGKSALALLDGTASAAPTTGLADLDQMTGGWPRGEPIIIAGRPGMAKSGVATCSAVKAAKAGHPVLFFSLEMRAEQLGARMLTDLAYTHESPIHYEDILLRRITDGRTRSRLEAAQKQLDALPIYIEEQRGLTIAEIGARSRKRAAACERAGHPLGAVFVDHLGLVRPSDRYVGQRVREIAEITDGLATLAKDLDIPVIALCQLNRNVEGRENKRAAMPDLRESGAIEEDASLIIFLYRAAYYLERERFDDPEHERQRLNALAEARNKIELQVAKNRNGRVGVVDAFIDIGANALRNECIARGLRAA
jgi:replicative DNA helicase